MMNRSVSMALLGAGLGVLAVVGIMTLVTRGGTSAQAPPATAPPSAAGPRGPMGGYGPGGMMNGGRGYGPGMMGGATTARSTAVTMPQAVQLAEQYLTQVGNADLTFDEVEGYSNNFYVALREQSTGAFAYELLIDRASGALWREPGPDMMWNAKYGMMGGSGYGCSYGSGGMMGGSGCGMMGGYGRTAPTAGTATVDTPVTEAQATAFAQTYLDTALPGTTVGDAHSFYGFRTIEVLRDGQMLGMLSVNGYTGAVWYHSWHGTFEEEWQRPSA